MGDDLYRGHDQSAPLHAHQGEAQVRTISLKGVDLDDKTTRILQKGLAVKYEDRFKSSLIDGNPCQETTGANVPGQSPDPTTQQAEDNPNAVTSAWNSRRATDLPTSPA